MNLNLHEAEVLKQFIKREIAPLKEHIEKLERQVRPSEPVGWGGHLPGKIEP